MFTPRRINTPGGVQLAIQLGNVVGENGQDDIFMKAKVRFYGIVGIVTPLLLNILYPVLTVLLFLAMHHFILYRN